MNSRIPARSSHEVVGPSPSRVCQWARVFQIDGLCLFRRDSGELEAAAVVLQRQKHRGFDAFTKCGILLRLMYCK